MKHSLVFILLTRINEYDKRLENFPSKSIYDQLIDSKIVRETRLANISIPEGDTIFSAKLQERDVKYPRTVKSDLADIVRGEVSLKIITNNHFVYYIKVNFSNALGRHPFREEVTTFRSSYESILKVD